MIIQETKKTSMQHLKVYNKQDVLSLTKLRKFETKVGERIQIVTPGADIETADAC